MDLGGPHFVELTTATNLALVGWEDFKRRIADGEKRLEERTAVGLLSIQDEAYRGIFFVICSVLFGSSWVGIRRFVWHSAYYLCVVAVIAGMFVLYLDYVSAWNGLLLLPAALQFAVGRFPLLVAGFVIFVAKRFLAASQTAQARIVGEAGRISELAESASERIPRPNLSILAPQNNAPLDFLEARSHLVSGLRVRFGSANTGGFRVEDFRVQLRPAELTRRPDGVEINTAPVVVTFLWRSDTDVNASRRLQCEISHDSDWGLSIGISYDPPGQSESSELAFPTANWVQALASASLILDSMHPSSGIVPRSES